MDALRGDLRYAIRALLRSPGFSAVAISTLALGIGLTTAVFSVVDTVLMRPLPFADGERIVVVWETLRDISRGSASPGHFRDWTEQSTVFEATAAARATTYNLADAGDPERVSAMRVTPGYFRVAHIPAVVGRYFAEQDVDAEERVVILSHGLWQSRFGSNPSIVGRTIRLSGEPFTVIGVASPTYALTDPGRAGLAGGFSAQLWTPLTFTPEERSNYGLRAFLVLAKLKPGISRDAAQADLEPITRRIAERNPIEMVSRWVDIQPLQDVLVGNVSMPLLLLFATVAFVLLIGCANIAGLLLARATARRKEIAIRASLGGSPSRIARQLLTESVTLAVAGGCLAIVVAQVAIRFFVNNAPQNVPRLGDAGLQPEVLLFAMAVTAMAAVVFGLAPAVRAARTDLQSFLHHGQNSFAGISRDRLRSLMVVGEVSLTAVLLVCAGLLVRSALNLREVPFGFDAQNVLTARLALPTARYQEADTIADAYRRMLEHIRAIPGVSVASASTNVPLGGNSVDAVITAEGKTFRPDALPSPHIRLVAEDYFQAVGMRIVRGRSLESSDMASGAAHVLVINERLAAILWPGEDPVGRRVSAWTAGPEPEWREVVGIVGDVRTFGRQFAVQPEMFMPYTQAPQGAWDVFQRSMVLTVRPSSSWAETYVTSLRHAVWAVDPSLPLYDVRTMANIVVASTTTGRFYMRLIALLAVTGLGLAALGLYGVIAYFVSWRGREIGIRVVLGARPSGVVRMVIRHGLTTTFAGIVIGLGAALMLTRLMTRVLFEVEPSDPQTFIAVAILLLMTTLLASYLPARRAARIDPVVALRAE